MREWISVKDRLPEIGVRVLVSDNEGFGVLSGRLMHKGWYLEGELDKNANVTDWQPLPKPPKPTNLIDSFIADGGFDRAMGCKNGE